MRFLRRALIGLLLLTISVGLLALGGNAVFEAIEERRNAEDQSRPVRERVFAANVVTVTPENIRPVLETFGEVRATRRLELRAATGGEVVWMAESFVDGGRVEQGDLLLRIDPAEAMSQRATAAADLAEAKADLRDAERALALADGDIAAAEEQADLRDRAVERQRDLLDRGVGSAQAVETAELAASSARQALLSRRQAEAAAQTRIEQAGTMVERRRIALEEAERRLADTEVIAVFSGALSDVDVALGRLVASGERLAELIDTSTVELAFRVSTPQYVRLLSETGQLVGAEVEASVDLLGVDLSASGRISRESPAVGEGQTGRLIFAGLERNPGFRPGDFVGVRIIEPEISGVARLPATAVDAAETVLVIGEEDRLEVAQTEVLRRQGDDVLVRAGDLAGREIVAERTPLLGAGIKIRPVRPGAAAAEEGPETIVLDPERRALLVAFVEANDRMPEEAKARVLAQLRQDEVPTRVVERIEERM